MSDLNHATDRAVALTDKIADVLLRALEVSSEKVDLAMEAAAMKARAEALFAVLEGVVAHRMALEEKLATLPHGPLKAMLAHQIDCVQAQQVSILVRSGMSTEDAAAVFAQPGLDEVPRQHLAHRHVFARIAQEIQVAHPFEPIKIVYYLKVLTLEKPAVLADDGLFVTGDFGRCLKAALIGFAIGVADKAGSAADQQDGVVAVAYEVPDHHGCSQVADRHGIGARVHPPIKGQRLAVKGG